MAFIAPKWRSRRLCRRTKLPTSSCFATDLRREIPGHRLFGNDVAATRLVLERAVAMGVGQSAGEASDGVQRVVDPDGHQRVMASVTSPQSSA